MLTCHLMDEGPNRVVNELAFEVVPTGNQAPGTARGQSGGVVESPMPQNQLLTTIDW